MPIQGILKPMPRYKGHYIAGCFIPEGGREFVVDDHAVKEFDDVAGAPLVLSPRGYAHAKKAFGTQLLCEPLGGVVDGASAAERISALSDCNAQLEAELAGHRASIDDLERSRAGFAEENTQLRARAVADLRAQTEKIAELEHAKTALAEENAQLRARVAELEAASSSRKK